jgi:mono/diheme cytochrome c family protein
MKFLPIFVLVVSLFLIQCGSPSMDTSQQPKDEYAKETPQDEGKNLFRLYCASCHHPVKDLTGPALKGAIDRVPNKEWLYQWIKNPQALIDVKDPYALKICEQWQPAVMNGYPNMTNEQIDLITAYIESSNY